MTEYHRMAGFNGRHLFLTVLEPGRQDQGDKIKASSVSGESPPPGSLMVILLCSHMADGVRELSGVIRALIAFLWIHLPNLIASQQPHLLRLSHCGLGFQQMNFGGRHSVYSTLAGNP